MRPKLIVPSGLSVTGTRRRPTDGSFERGPRHTRPDRARLCRGHASPSAATPPRKVQRRARAAVQPPAPRPVQPWDGATPGGARPRRGWPLQRGRGARFPKEVGRAALLRATVAARPEAERLARIRLARLRFFAD